MVSDIRAAQNSEFVKIRIPAGSGPKSEVKPLEKVDATLRAAKTALDPYENDERLVQLLRMVDPYAPLRYKLKKERGGQVVTNAWMKMYEMAGQLGLVPEERKEFRVFCNAELPGAFLCAINHFVRTKRPGMRLEWVAASLHPGRSRTALGDQYGLYAGNLDRWLMDRYMRGDLTDPSNVRTLAQRAKERLGGDGVDLYTSDAGIDVAGDYNRQEELTAKVHLGQVLAGLGALRVGGSLLVKTYTFTSPFSISLVAQLAESFGELYVVKPKASRLPNSEVYLVGKNYLGGVHAELWATLESFSYSAPVGPVAANTLTAIASAARYIHQVREVAALEAVVRLYLAHRSRLKQLKGTLITSSQTHITKWMGDNPVGTLKYNQQVWAAKK